MDKIKVVLLRSNTQRHIRVANKIAENFDLTGIISEPKPKLYQEVISQSKIVARYFKLNK